MKGKKLFYKVPLGLLLIAGAFALIIFIYNFISYNLAFIDDGGQVENDEVQISNVTLNKKYLTFTVKNKTGFELDVHSYVAEDIGYRERAGETLCLKTDIILKPHVTEEISVLCEKEMLFNKSYKAGIRYSKGDTKGSLSDVYGHINWNMVYGGKPKNFISFPGYF